MPLPGLTNTQHNGLKNGWLAQYLLMFKSSRICSIYCVQFNAALQP